MLGGKEGEIARNLFQALSEHGRLSETQRVVEGFFELEYPKRRMENKVRLDADLAQSELNCNLTGQGYRAASAL